MIRLICWPTTPSQEQGKMPFNADQPVAMTRINSFRLRGRIWTATLVSGRRKVRPNHVLMTPAPLPRHPPKAARRFVRIPCTRALRGRRACSQFLHDDSRRRCRASVIDIGIGPPAAAISLDMVCVCHAVSRRDIKGFTQSHASLSHRSVTR